MKLEYFRTPKPGITAETYVEDCKEDEEGVDDEGHDVGEGCECEGHPLC